MGAVNLGRGDDVAKFETRDVRLAASLMAVGIRPAGAEPVRIITQANRSGEARQFYFEEVSECGAHKTRALVAAWREGLAWIEANENHPFAAAMAAHMNHRDLLDYVKGGVAQVVMQKGKAVAMLPVNASADLEAKILGRFE